MEANQTTSLPADEQVADLAAARSASREDAILRTLMDTLNRKAAEASETAMDLVGCDDEASAYHCGTSCAFAEAASIIANVINN